MNAAMMTTNWRLNQWSSEDGQVMQRFHNKQARMHKQQPLRWLRHKQAKSNELHADVQLGDAPRP
jgi:hypothetical protein